MRRIAEHHYTPEGGSIFFIIFAMIRLVTCYLPYTAFHFLLDDLVYSIFCN